MPCEQQQDDDAAHHDTIDTKGFEAIFRQITDKPFHGQQRHDKGDDTAQDQHGDVMGGGPRRVFLHQVEQVEQRGACHRRHSQEERELGGAPAGDYDEKYRNLPFIGVLKPEVYNK